MRLFIFNDLQAILFGSQCRVEMQWLVTSGEWLEELRMSREGLGVRHCWFIVYGNHYNMGVKGGRKWKRETGKCKSETRNSTGCAAPHFGTGLYNTVPVVSRRAMRRS